MPEITVQRNSQFLRVIFEILADRPDGVPAKEVLDAIPKRVALTEFEKGYYPTAPNSPRYVKIVRFATIGAVKAGWMVKTKGRWYITEEGKAALHKHTKPDELYREAGRLYQIWKASRTDEVDLDEDGSTIPGKVSLTLEEIQEQAQQQIQDVLRGLNPYEFQDLVADLLKAMGYYIYWVAPPGKDAGMDIIAYKDPLGASGPRVKVQVKHRIDQSIPVEPLRAFMSVVGADEIGIFVSSGGFTNPAWEESRTQEKRKITLLDQDGLVELWIEYYSKLSEEARQRFPIVPVYFPAAAE